MSKLAAVVALALAACAAEPTALRVAEAPAGQAEPAAWSYSGGSEAVYPPGVRTYPVAVAIKVELHRQIDERDHAEAIAAGAIAVQPGSACALTRAATCDGAACVGEIELRGPGVCILQVRAATPSGAEHAQCWHRAEAIGDVDDPALAAALSTSVAAALEECEAGL